MQHNFPAALQKYLPFIFKSSPQARRQRPIRKERSGDVLLPSLNLAYFLESNVSIFADIVLSLKQEVLRRGIIWKPRFVVKCQECGSEYQEKKHTCDCGGINLREPNRQQIQLFKRKDGRSFLEAANLNDQTLETVLAEMVRHMVVGDNSYLLCIKNYAYLSFSGQEKLIATPLELLSLDPREITPIQQPNGLMGGRIWVCALHREITADKPQQICKICGHELEDAYYESSGLSTAKTHYIKDEIRPAPVFYPSLYGGYPPILKMIYDAYAYHYMELRTYNYHKKGRPPGFLAFPTNNLESLNAQWEALLARAQEDPDNLQALGYDPGNGKGVAQLIQLMKDPGPDMLEVKKDLRERMGSMFGVSLIFQGDVSASGGLNNEGLQVTVTNRAVEFLQTPFNGREQNNYIGGVLYWICQQFGITDFVLQLLPSEEQDEMAEKMRFGQDITNARGMWELGFDIEFEDNKFTFSGKAKPKPEPQPFGGGGMPLPAPAEPEEPVEIDRNTGEPINASRQSGTPVDLHRMSKEKVYIKNPADAPEGVKVLQGARGGIYYESEAGTAQEKPQQEQEQGQDKPQSTKPEQEKPKDEMKPEDKKPEKLPNYEMKIPENTKVFHGTAADFDEFDFQEARRESRRFTEQTGGAGIYFTTDPSVAQDYANYAVGEKGNEEDTRPRVVEVELNPEAKTLDYNAPLAGNEELVRTLTYPWWGHWDDDEDEEDGRGKRAEDLMEEAMELSRDDLVIDNSELGKVGTIGRAIENIRQRLADDDLLSTESPGADISNEASKKGYSVIHYETAFPEGHPSLKYTSGKNYESWLVLDDKGLKGKPSEQKKSDTQKCDCGIEKEKVYIKNPADAPEGVKVYEGTRGGIYYESEAGTAQEKPQQEQEQEKPKPEASQDYADFKRVTANQYKGFDGKHDVYVINKVKIRIPPDDVPTDISKRVNRISKAFEYSTLKDEPVIEFTGKSYKQELTYVGSDGKEYQSQYAGSANYDENRIKMYDDFEVENIIDHEVGHFVSKQLFYAKSDPPAEITGLEHINNVQDYLNLINILKKHDALRAEELRKIMGDVDYARDSGIMREMHDAGLQYYDNGYEALYGVEKRLQNNLSVDIDEHTEKAWKRYRKDLKAQAKSNIIRSEWEDIYKAEGYEGDIYAGRNESEAFAESYQSLSRILRGSIDNDTQRKHLLELWANKHPKKYGFFKKHVLKKWLT